MKNQQLSILNCLRADFKKWATNNEPSSYELDVNKIGKQISGFNPDSNPTILLDCVKSDGYWYICTDNSDPESGCCPIETLSKEQVYEIRRLVESWLARKDMDNLFI